MVLLSITCNYVFSSEDGRGLLFLFVLRIVFVILLWQSLGLPCNNFGSTPEEKFSCDETLDLLNDF